MKTFIEKICGVNWRSSLGGFLESAAFYLTILAGAPYQLGEVATFIPPEWKAELFKWAGMATVALRIINGINGKDKQVSGNPSEGYLVGPRPAEPPRLVVNTAPVNVAPAL